MVYSMTGYGKVNEVINGRDITVEIKSVNHRYFEYSSRIPRIFFVLDDKIKKEVSKRVSRGKIEVSLSIRNIETSSVNLSTDIPLAKSYLEAINDIATELSLNKIEDVMQIVRYEGVLTPVKNEEDTDALWQDVLIILNKTLDEFVNMRKIEGEKLKEDITSRLETIKNITNTIEKSAPERVNDYTQKLFTRLKTILEDKQIDESRILTEAAIFADKTAVDEEITRLNSHILQYEEILKDTKPQGRKLDFLTQELNREANTIGSKSNDIEITRLVVDIKSEIEKIREQIQNIE